MRMKEAVIADKKLAKYSNKEIVRCWLSYNKNEKRAERTLEGIFTALNNCEEPAVFNTLRDINSRGEDISKSVSLSLLQHAVCTITCKFVFFCIGDIHFCRCRYSEPAVWMRK